jgi:acetoin utilization protein AcuB
MTVGMWMTKAVVTIPPETTLLEAAALMSRRRIRRLPVMDAHVPTRIIGMLSAGDILRACGPEVNPFAVEVPANARTTIAIATIMTRNLFTTSPEAPIEDAAKLMRDRKVGGLPVIHDSILAGLITESDIFRAFVSLFSTHEHGVRITFDVSEGEDVFGMISEAARRRKVRVVSLISAHQEDRPVCVVRLTGAGADAILDEIWSTGHRVLNVLRFPV